MPRQQGLLCDGVLAGPVPKRGRTPPGQSRQQLAPRSESCTWAVICFGRSHGVCLSCAPTAGSVSAWTLDAVSVPPRLLQLSEETDGSRRTVPLWCRSVAGTAGEGSPRLPPGGAAHAPWGGAAILVPPGAAASGGHLSAPLPPCPAPGSCRATQLAVSEGRGGDILRSEVSTSWMVALEGEAERLDGAPLAGGRLLVWEWRRWMQKIRVTGQGEVSVSCSCASPLMAEGSLWQKGSCPCQQRAWWWHTAPCVFC